MKKQIVEYSSDENGSMIATPEPKTRGTLYIDDKERVECQMFESLKIVITNGGQLFSCILRGCSVYVNKGAAMYSCVIKEGTSVHIEKGGKEYDCAITDSKLLEA